jgi:hypothetical protein
MVEDMTTPPGQPREQLVGQWELVVQLLVGLGLVLSIVGLVDGLRLAFKKHVAPCPNGHEFPKGTTNFNCYVHPQAGLGIGIAVLSALLGVLIVISALGVVAVFRSAEGAAST